MRTITFDVYNYDELSAPAKEKALESMRETIGSCRSDDDAYEYRAALEKIEEIFEIKVYDWCVGYPGTYSRWRFKEGSRFSEMSDEPRFLVRYLDEVERWCRKGKYYSSPFRKVPVDKEHPAGLDYTKRYSKVMFERNCCLTGSWTSCIVDDYTGAKRWEYVRKGRTIEDFLDDMLYDFFKQWERDQECNYEDETIEDEILNRDYEFMEDGRRYVA